MSKLDVLQLGISAHREGRIDDAANLYGTILSVEPDHPDALHYLGLILHQRGESEDGAALIERSLSIAPEQPSALNNLGNIYRLLGHDDDAARAYWAAIKFDPGHANAWSNLAIMHRARGEPETALKAVKIGRHFDPVNFTARHTHGLVLIDMKDYDGAAEVFRSCIRDGLVRGTIPLIYANILNRFDRGEEALAVLEDWLAAEPDNPIARHQVEAQRGNTIAGAPEAYVKKTFDDFADTFDGVLKNLGYDAPRRAAEVAARHFSGRTIGEAIDLGCGTGLAGTHLRPLAERLTGVDLSSKMLIRARNRKTYDALVEGEIAAVLDDGPSGRYDLAVSTDVLIYFGDIGAVLRAVSRALAPAGALVATFEVLDDDTSDPGYVLRTSGRFAHSAAYLARQAAAAGLSLAACERFDLRQELDRMIEGYMVTFVKAH